MMNTILFLNCTIGFGSHFESGRDGSWGTLVFFILTGILLTILDKLIERYCYECGEAYIYTFGLIVGGLGFLGGFIGMETSGVGAAIGYYCLLSVLGGFIATNYLLDYDMKRRILVSFITPITIGIGGIVGVYIDS